MKITRVLIRNLEIMGEQNKPSIISWPEDCQSMSGNQTTQSRKDSQRKTRRMHPASVPDEDI